MSERENPPIEPGPEPDTTDAAEPEHGDPKDSDAAVPPPAAE